MPLCSEAADEIVRLTAARKRDEAEIERLRVLVQAMLDNEPGDMAADGVTVFDVWRKDARRALEGKMP